MGFDGFPRFAFDTLATGHLVVSMAANTFSHLLFEGEVETGRGIRVQVLYMSGY